nr:RING-H2 finger protein ATL46-like [Ipomoea batatas]
MGGFREPRWLSEQNSWVQYHKDGVLTYSPPVSGVSGSFQRQPSSPAPPSGNKISPAVLFIIVILAVLFFISGLLHLLVRFLVKNPSSSAEFDGNPEASTSDALQRQLQQLFHLHDSGLDQAFIDALPVFMYKEIVGPKEPFDCAVCLGEFLEKDKLRLLPTCGHAFHINCIDTWLLSNSTCPLCRGALFNGGFSIDNPMFDYDGLGEEDGGCPQNGDNGNSISQKTSDLKEIVVEKGSFPVRLGKFRKLNNLTVEWEGETSSSNLDARRCYSMGSYQYVVGDANLRVALNSRRNAGDAKRVKSRDQDHDAEGDGRRIGIGAKTDSYSMSKIWLGKFASSPDSNVEDPPRFDMVSQWMSRAEGK